MSHGRSAACMRRCTGHSETNGKEVIQCRVGLRRCRCSRSGSRGQRSSLLGLPDRSRRGLPFGVEPAEGRTASNLTRGRSRGGGLFHFLAVSDRLAPGVIPDPRARHSWHALAHPQRHPGLACPRRIPKCHPRTWSEDPPWLRGSTSPRSRCHPGLHARDPLRRGDGVRDARTSCAKPHLSQCADEWVPGTSPGMTFVGAGRFGTNTFRSAAFRLGVLRLFSRVPARGRGGTARAVPLYIWGCGACRPARIEWAASRQSPVIQARGRASVRGSLAADTARIR